MSIPLKRVNTTLGPREIAFKQRQANDRARLLSTGAFYHLPESLEYYYAVACVEIVLLHSDKANTIYREIVRAWDLPGCHIYRCL